MWISGIETNKEGEIINTDLDYFDIKDKMAPYHTNIIDIKATWIEDKKDYSYAGTPKDKPMKLANRINELYKKLKENNSNLTCENFKCIVEDILNDYFKKKQVCNPNNKECEEEIIDIVRKLKSLCYMVNDKNEFPNRNFDWIPKEKKAERKAIVSSPGELNADGILIHEPVGRKKPRALVYDAFNGKGTSVHFIVEGNTGHIYSCIPLDKKAYHCYICTQGFKKGPHCTAEYCTLFNKKGNTVDNEYPSSCKDHSPSFNDSKISIEICETNNKTDYQNNVIPSVVELCAWLCYIFDWNPLERTSDTDVILDKEKGVDEYNANKESSLDITDAVNERIPKTIITHREAHLFYRRASNHRDPDSYWFEKKIKITDEMLINIGIDKNDFLRSINANEELFKSGLYLVPKYFRRLVNEKLKMIISKEESISKKEVIMKYCNPMLWLLIPKNIKKTYM